MTEEMVTEFDGRTAIVMETDGTRRYVTLGEPRDILLQIYRELSVVHIEAVMLPGKRIGAEAIDMFVDDEGRLNGSVPNLFATRLIRTLHGGVEQVIFGNVLLAAHDDDGETIGLSAGALEFLMNVRL